MSVEEHAARRRIQIEADTRAAVEEYRAGRRILDRLCGIARARWRDYTSARRDDEAADARECIERWNRPGLLSSSYAVPLDAPSAEDWIAAMAAAKSLRGRRQKGK